MALNGARLITLPAFTKKENCREQETGRAGALRAAFHARVESRSVDRDGPGADTMDKMRTPRYRFCIYADEETVGSVSATPRKPISILSFAALLTSSPGLTLKAPSP